MRKFGGKLGYSICDVYDNYRRKILTILEKQQGGTKYRIILEERSFNFYADNLDATRVNEALNYLKEALEEYVKMIEKLCKKSPNIDNVVFTKGYEVAEKEKLADFVIIEECTTSDRIGVRIKTDSENKMQVLVHSFFLNENDVSSFFKNICQSVDKLYMAHLLN